MLFLLLLAVFGSPSLEELLSAIIEKLEPQVESDSSRKKLERGGAETVMQPGGVQYLKHSPDEFPEFPSFQEMIGGDWDIKKNAEEFGMSGKQIISCLNSWARDGFKFNPWGPPGGTNCQNSYNGPVSPSPAAQNLKRYMENIMRSLGKKSWWQIEDGVGILDNLNVDHLGHATWMEQQQGGLYIKEASRRYKGRENNAGKYGQLICQKWTSQTPNRHDNAPSSSKQYWVDLGEENTSHNYCRNPDGEPEGPWCYVDCVQSGIDCSTAPRWAYCGFSYGHRCYGFKGSSGSWGSDCAGRILWEDRDENAF